MRRTIDGFVQAPQRRPQLPDDGSSKDLKKIGDMPANSRLIGDFSQKSGYHAANSLGSASGEQNEKQRESEDQSLLYKTLPSSERRFGRRKKEGKGAKKHPRLRKSLLWFGLAVVAIALIVGGFLMIKGYFKVHKVFKGGGSATGLHENVDPSLLKGEGDGRVNVLLLGRGGEGHDGANLTDTILLASIDPVNKNASLVSVPRDFWVKSPAGGTSKINAVFANTKTKALKQGKSVQQADEAGAMATEQVVKDMLGVNIHYYGLIDFQAFQQAVDTVGGVTIDVPEDLRDASMAWQNGGKSLLVAKGQHTLDGRMSLKYVRSRHGSARGDFDRGERQRLFIAALSQKIASAKTYTNPVKVSQLMDAFGNHTSTDFSLQDAMRLIAIGKAVGTKFESIDLADPAKPLVKTGMISGQSVVLPAAGANNYSAIQLLVRSKLKDGYIVKENAVINMLNGTVTAGLAGQKAEELRSYGYNIGTVGDAPTKAYEKTVIIDLSKGKKPYTKNYLEKRFGVKATSKLPDKTIVPGTASFIIIVGRQ